MKTGVLALQWKQNQDTNQNQTNTFENAQDAKNN